jgi:hypothetical protein
MLIAITEHTDYVDYHFDLAYKCIKVIYTSHLSTQSFQDLKSISNIISMVQRSVHWQYIIPYVQEITIDITWLT